MALAAELSSVEPAIIFITGAGNARKTPRRSLRRYIPRPLDIVHELHEVHADVTEGLYRSLGGVVANEVIVPANFGAGTPSLSYRLIKGIIAEQVRKYEGRPIRLRGHSLGGFLAAEYVHEHPEQDIEVDAWASPFGKVNFMPGVGYLFQQRTNRMRKIREEMGDEAPRITLVASEGDLLIPTSSSLPDLPGVDRILLTRDREAAVSNGIFPIEVKAPPGHIAILNHPDALSLHEDITYRPRLLSVVEA